MAFEQVEIIAATPCFAPKLETVNIQSSYTLPISQYKVQVYDYSDRLIYEDASPTAAATLPNSIPAWDGKWNKSAPATPPPGGGNDHYVNPLLAPFRIVLLAEPKFPSSMLTSPIQTCKVAAAMAASATGIPLGFKSSPIAGLDHAALGPRIGKDVTTVRYAGLKLRLMGWDEVYRQKSGGKDFATVPYGEARNIKIMWVQAKLNSIGCFAGAVTGDEGQTNRSGSNALGNALFRYRMNRRIPTDGRSIPQGGPAAPAALTPVDLETFCDTNETAAGLRHTWNGSDFVAADGRRADLKRLKDDDELHQIMAFLAMEDAEPTLVDASDPPGDIGADFTNSMARARLLIECTRCPNNNVDEWVEGNYVPGHRPQTHKFEKECDWLSDPMIPLEAALTIEQSDGSAVVVPEAMGDVRVNWNWKDEDELTFQKTPQWLLPAAAPARPTRAGDYLNKAMPLVRKQGGFYRNCPQECGGIVSGTDDNDFIEVFRKFADGTAFSEKAAKRGTDPGGALDASALADGPLHVSRVWFCPSLIAGDNYVVRSHVDFSKGFGGANNSDARRDVLEKLHEAHQCKNARLPGSVTTRHNPNLADGTCRITIWRRLRFRMLVQWPDRRGWGSAQGQSIFNGLDDQDQPINGNALDAHWDEVRKMFRAAYVYIPPLGNVPQEPVAANFTPTFAQDYVNQLMQLSSPFEHLLGDVDLSDVYQELANVCETELNQAIAEACTPSKAAATVNDANLIAFCKTVETWKSDADPQVKRAGNHYANILSKLVDYDEIVANKPGQHKYPGNPYFTDPKLFTMDGSDNRQTIKRLEFQAASTDFTQENAKVAPVEAKLRQAIAFSLSGAGPVDVTDPDVQAFCVTVKGWKTHADSQVKELGDHYSTALTEIMNYGQISQGKTGKTKKLSQTMISKKTAQFEDTGGTTWAIKPKVFEAPSSAYTQAMTQVPEDSIKNAIDVSKVPPPVAPPKPITDATFIGFINRVDNDWSTRVPDASHSNPNDPQFKQYVTNKVLKAAGGYYKSFMENWITRDSSEPTANVGYYKQDINIATQFRGNEQVTSKLKKDQGGAVLPQVKLFDPLPECRQFCQFSPTRMAPGRLPDGLTVTQLRSKNADALSGNFAYIIAMLVDKAVDRRLRGGLVNNGKFTRRQEGLVVIDNNTIPATLGDQGQVLAPFGLSMFTPLDLVFTSFNTPYLFPGTLAHEIGHALFLKHWQNAAGASKIDHDQADCNCVMSYPLLPYGNATNLATADPAQPGELPLADQTAWMTAADEPTTTWMAKYTNVKNGTDGFVRVVNKHFLPKRYLPHFCGKCNLNLRGWNIYAAKLPMASKDPMDGTDYIPAAANWQATKSQTDTLWPVP